MSFGRTVAAVAEAGAVVVAADARLQAHAVDDVAGAETKELAVGVELVEVGHAQRQVRVGEQLDGLGLGGAQHELRDAYGAVCVHALKLGGIGTLREQAGELLRRGDGIGILLGRAHHDAAGVQVVVESLALAQELWAEEDLLVAQPLAKARCIAHRDGRLDDDPGIRVHRAHGGDGGLDGARVEEVPVRVVVGGRGDDGVVGARVGFCHVDGGVQVELALPRLGLREEALDLVVLDGRNVVVDLIDLLGHDVQRVDLVVLREQDGEGQADVAGAGDSDLHVILQLSKNNISYEKWPLLQGHDFLNVVVALIPLGKGPQAILKRRRGLIAQVALERRGVGVGDGHVAGLHRHELLVGLEVVVGGEHALLHQHALQRVDEVEQVLGVRVADVVDAVRGERQPVLAHLHLGGGVHDAPDALDDVVDEGEVAAAVAHVEDLDGVAAAQLLGEPEIGHIGPAHGAVHREEAQAGGGDGVELGVGGGHELIGLLGGGVERHRRVHAVLLGERHLLVAAVDRAGTGVDQVLDRVVAAGLEDVEEADEVALQVSARILDGVAHARLRSEVNHDVEAVLREQALNQRGVAEVALHEREAAVLIRLGEHRQAGLLDAGVVVAVDVVQADDHVVGLLEQLLHQERPDETGGPGNENLSLSHICTPSQLGL